MKSLAFLLMPLILVFVLLLLLNLSKGITHELIYVDASGNPLIKNTSRGTMPPELACLHELIKNQGWNLDPEICAEVQRLYPRYVSPQNLEYVSLSIRGQND